MRLPPGDDLSARGKAVDVRKLWIDAASDTDKSYVDKPYDRSCRSGRVLG
jgi:hypothetical protein